MHSDILNLCGMAQVHHVGMPLLGVCLARESQHRPRAIVGVQTDKGCIYRYWNLVINAACCMFYDVRI